jgi:hypothetical protein
MAVFTIRMLKNGRTLLRKQVSEGQGRDAVVIPAQADVSYVFSDVLTNSGPARISAKRVGQNLQVALNKGNPDSPEVIIEGYYNFSPAPIAGVLPDGGQAVYDLGTLALAAPEAAGTSTAPAAAKTTSTQASLQSNSLENLEWVGAGGLLGLAALGIGKSDGGNAVDPAIAAQAKISAYAADGNQTPPTVEDYTNAGVKGVNSGNLAAINSAVDALQSANVDSKTNTQIVVDAYSKILAEANGAAADATPGVNPLASDYQAIGANVSLANSNTAALSLLNEVVGNLTTTAIDSVAKINAVAAVIDKVMIAAAGSPANMNITDYTLLGLTTSGSGAVTAINLAAVNNALTSSGGQTNVDSYSKVSALVTAVATIVSYAEDNTQASPTLAQYTSAGTKGVVASNLDAINSAVDANVASGVETKAKLQAIVDAYNVVLAEANGSAADATPTVNPTAGQYALIGANIGLASTNTSALGSLNDVLAELPATAVDSIAKINILAGVTNKIIATNPANPSSLALAEFTLLGLPTSGASGVTGTNFGAINSALTNISGSSKLDSKTKIQTVVDAYNKILAEANGTAADTTPAINPLVSDYQAIGANIGISTSNTLYLSLLNDVVSNLTTTSVDTVAKINNLAALVDKILNTAAGAPTALTIADFTFLGLPSSGSGAVTAVNLAAVSNAIAGAGGQARVDTFAELSGLITAVATIVSYADDRRQAVPTLAQYNLAGINGVTASNLDAINSAVDANTASAVDTKAGLQAIVDSYNLILAEANGSATDATPGVNPTAAQYALIGADIGLAVKNPAALSLLNEVVSNLTTSAVDSIDEINALAVVVGKVINVSSGASATISLADYALLGLPNSGPGAVTAFNLAAVTNSIASAGGQSKLDTYAKFGGLVTGVATIVSYADDNSQAVPTLNQYLAAGITGVTTTSLGAINSAVDANTAGGVDTKVGLQAVVDSYNLILAEANGSAPDATPGVNPSSGDYAAIGASIGLASGGITSGSDLASSALALLDNAVAGLTTTQVDTIGEINTLASVVDKIMNLAKLGTGSAIPAGAPSMSDLTLLGVNTTLANTPAEVNAILQALIDSTDSGSGINTILALQTIVNANAT